MDILAGKLMIFLLPLVFVSLARGEQWSIEIHTTTIDQKQYSRCLFGAVFESIDIPETKQVQFLQLNLES